MRSWETRIPSRSTPCWPAAVEILNENGESPIILTCEHASNYIPREYRRLGLDEFELRRHIAWDIGAADVTRSLANRLDAIAFLGAYSRLLIDLNRPLDVDASIPTRSEDTDIPGNVGIDEIERRRRVQRIFVPFHDRIDAHLDQREREGRISIIVAIHSFTATYRDKERPWHIGILYGKAKVFGEIIVSRLSSDRQIQVGSNVPYGVSSEEDYGLLVHGDYRRLPAVIVEIRNDQVSGTAGVAEYVRRLEAALTSACSSLFIGRGD